MTQHSNPGSRDPSFRSLHLSSNVVTVMRIWHGRSVREMDPSVTSVITVTSRQRQVDVFRGRPPQPHAYQPSRNSA